VWALMQRVIPDVVLYAEGQSCTAGASSQLMEGVDQLHAPPPWPRLIASTRLSSRAPQRTRANHSRPRGPGARLGLSRDPPHQHWRGATTCNWLFISRR